MDDQLSHPIGKFEISYFNLFRQLMQRRSDLVRQRDEAEVELSKLTQTIVSVFAMLSEDQQKANQDAIDALQAESTGLQDAVKLVFSTHEGDWLTVSNVRDYLTETGFDFREYKANPLASIGTTLKRIASTGFLEVTSSGSGTLYRRSGPMMKISDLMSDKPPNFVPPNTPADARALESVRRAMARKK